MHLEVRVAAEEQIDNVGCLILVIPCFVKILPDRGGNANWLDAVSPIDLLVV